LTDTRLPAEWEKQNGILLSWPTRTTDWASNLADVEACYLSLITAICRFETAHICCQDENTRTHAFERLTERNIDMSHVVLHTLPYNDTWTRDYGPITVQRAGAPVWLNFRFNAWGNKYPHALDDRVTGTLHEASTFAAIEMVDCNFVLEGGSIDSNGSGSLLTTAHCLLSPQRNPGQGRAQIEHRLCDLLGVQQVLWLENGHLEGDDTDAHVDTLARFCHPDTIAYTQCTNPADNHAVSLDRMQRELASMRQPDGDPFRLVPLPLPEPCFSQQGQRLPATYANFLIINGAVLVPVYGVDTDGIALQRLRATFPDRRVIGIPCRALLEQYGSLHCITMHLPAGAVPVRGEGG
jgi:agmatine/peptidylarginine deiminase